MTNLKTALKEKLIGARKVAVLGVGSELRSDDALGVVIAKDIRSYAKKMRLKGLKVFLGQTAPENFTGQIKKFRPTHLLIIDAIDFQKKSGSIGIIDACKAGGASFSTHRMPVKFIRDYLYQSIACSTLIVGIQPQSLDFCAGLSPQIQDSVKIVSQELKEILGRLCPGKKRPHRLN